MKCLITIILMFVAVPANTDSYRTPAQDHLWTDASGNYQINAEFIARNEHSVILRLEDKSMLIVDIDDLCDADRAYLADIQARRDAAQDRTLQESGNETGREQQNWKLINGTTVTGNVAEHGRRLIQLRRRGGRAYVNDRPFRNLPEFYQQLVPTIVNHFEETSIRDGKELAEWLKEQEGGARSYTVEGVLLETYEGDLYGVPFFMFDQEDRAVLSKGWEEWKTADKDARYQAELALRLRAESIARQRFEATTLQLQRLHLQLEAYDAGLFDLWKVTMLPRGATRGLGIQVIVPARNSEQAAKAAREKFPDMRVASIVKVRRY